MTNSRASSVLGRHALRSMSGSQLLPDLPLPPWPSLSSSPPPPLPPAPSSPPPDPAPPLVSGSMLVSSGGSSTGRTDTLPLLPFSISPRPVDPFDPCRVCSTLLQRVQCLWIPLLLQLCSNGDVFGVHGCKSISPVCSPCIAGPMILACKTLALAILKNASRGLPKSHLFRRPVH